MARTELARRARSRPPPGSLQSCAGSATRGSATHIRSLVTQLRKFGFAGGRGDVVEADRSYAPHLDAPAELGIDGERMMTFVRREVLAQLLAEREARAPAEDDDPGVSLLAVLDRLGGSTAISHLERETKEKRTVFKRRLQMLIDEGRVRPLLLGTARPRRWVREEHDSERMAPATRPPLGA